MQHMKIVDKGMGGRIFIFHIYLRQGVTVNATQIQLFTRFMNLGRPGENWQISNRRRNQIWSTKLCI